MNHEKGRVIGAEIMSVLALSGLASVVARTANAAPKEAESPLVSEKYKMPHVVPEGVKPLKSQEAILKEAAEALSQVHERWNGVLVLHHATKANAGVGFATSPTSYTSENPDLFIFSPKSDDLLVIPKPGIVKFKNREYAVVIDVDHGGGPAFLDLTFAQEVGALDSYAFKGARPRAQKHTFSSENNDLPYQYTSDHYGPQWRFTKIPTLESIYLPTNTDTHRKLYKVNKTKTMPHA
jgi:hypothetical protein